MLGRRAAVTLLHASFSTNAATQPWTTGPDSEATMNPFGLKKERRSW
jgi:hypothetical protein